MIPPEPAELHRTDPDQRPSRARQLRWVAIDAILPGAGHLAAGRHRLAILFGIPVVVALGALGVMLATTSIPRLVAQAVNALGVVLLIQGIVLVWRLLAVGAGVAAVGPHRPIARHGLAVGLLLVAVIVPQAYLGYVTNVAREEVDRVFTGTTEGAWQPAPTSAPTVAPSATLGPSASLGPSPSPAPSPAIPRVNILLIGIDSGVGRNTAATDTMIVASLDPVSETVSMISIPRDMVDVPLPDGTVYRPKLNSLDSDARHHPSKFPGSDGTGHDVLMAAIGTLLGLEIDYYAAVSLGGFVKVVNTLGGVDVSVSRKLCDPGYTEFGFEHGFSIAAGLRHLNGLQALAYARIRRTAGESDFTRAARQQEVISGLRDAVVTRGYLSDPVALLQALGRAMQTNVPRDLLPDLADVMVRVDRAHTYRAVIKSPLVQSGFDARGSIQIPDVAAIRALSTDLFPPSGTMPRDEYAAPPPATSGKGSGTGNCLPPATPTPIPTATPVPTPEVTAEPTPVATGPAATPAPSPISTVAP